MDPLSTARYGMMAAANRLAVSAVRIAAGEGDAVRESVDQIEARQQFVASAQVAGFASDMWRALMQAQTR